MFLRTREFFWGSESLYIDVGMITASSSIRGKNEKLHNADLYQIEPIETFFYVP